MNKPTETPNAQYLGHALSTALLIVVVLFSFCGSGATVNEFHTVEMDTFRFKEDGENYELRNKDPTDGDADRMLLAEGGMSFSVESSLNHAPNGSAWMDSLSNALRTEMKSDLAHANVLQPQAQVPIRSSNGDAGYTVTLGVGNPSQKVEMTLDTAVALSWVNCREGFDPTGSKSFRLTKCGYGGAECPPLGNSVTVMSGCSMHRTCTFEVSLADGSNIAGHYITEVLRAGGFFYGFHMGCSNQVGSFAVLSLSRSPLSMPSQIYGGVFSYCLPNFLSQRAKGSLLIGNGSVPHDVKMFTPMQTNPDIAAEFYLLELEAISVGSEWLHFPQEIGGLKTATTIQSANLVTRLVSPAYEALRAAFLRQTSHLKKADPYADLDPCFEFSGFNSTRIPAIIFHFRGNAKLVIKDIGTLLVVKPGVACLAFVPSAPDSLLTVIGSVQQQGIRISFDNAKNQIGFASNSC